MAMSPNLQKSRQATRQRAGAPNSSADEVFGTHRPEGLWHKPLAAKGFYAAIATATAIGVVMNFSSINPIKALYWSQVINGIVAVPVMVLVMRVAADPKIMEKFAITGWLKFLGWGATGVMAAAVVGMGFASVI